MKFGFVVYPQIQLMDVVGPLEVINMWRQVDSSIEVVYIAENMEPINCGSGFLLNIDYTFTDAPVLDYLCVPGGSGRLTQMNNINMLDFVRKQYLTCKVMLAVCTGSVILYNAGILKGHEFTTYWRALHELSHISDATITENRVVKSGKIWTSGGVSSGIDLIFELICDIAGKETAGKVQLLFEYFPADKAYCTSEILNELPVYPTEKAGHIRRLPEYIKTYIDIKS